MTLTELATPLFLFVVALRREIRLGVTLDYSDEKRGVLALFARLDGQAAANAMTDRWNRAKIPLAYLVDEVATMEIWSGQDTWNNHPLEVEFLGHNEKMRGAWFFDQEYKFALDSGDVEYTQILYLCICLGFEGKYRGQTVQLKNHTDTLYSRLPQVHRDAEPENKLYPACYVVDKTSNDPKVPMRVATMVTVFVGILVTYFVSNYVVYDSFVKELSGMQ
jgi:type IV/VI secretion system ImpK/VasF family protein